MNLVVGAPFWLVALLIMALAAAAIEDLVRLKISNLTCVAVLAGALVAVALQGLSWSLWQNALLCVLIFAVGTPLFAAGWLGGGDVKLLAALGLWFDLGAALGLIAAIFLAGGVLGLVYLTARLFTQRRDRRIPYGLAIVGGALFVFGMQLSPRSANSYIERLKAKEAAEHQLHRSPASQLSR
jgi:prepilin peptidase CpaA